jgi:H+/Cl- antiporter ClcA
LYNNKINRLLTSEEIEVRVWAIVVIIVTVILAGIVGFMLYSVTFVTQPIKSMAPIDQAYTKMLNDIVLLIVGGIGGVMTRKGVQAVSDKLHSNQTPPPAVTPAATPAVSSAVSSSLPNFNWMGITNPALDEEWRPPPPPTTPPDYVDPAKEEIAVERAAARSEA